jgi:hypothetical protein
MMALGYLLIAGFAWLLPSCYAFTCSWLLAAVAKAPHTKRTAMATQELKSQPGYGLDDQANYSGSWSRVRFYLNKIKTELSR